MNIANNFYNLYIFQNKQKEITELLTKADNLAAENRSYQDVYTAMAQSLAEAWRDLNTQLEYRTKLLQQSIAFHRSADIVSNIHKIIKMF